MYTHRGELAILLSPGEKYKIEISNKKQKQSSRNFLSQHSSIISTAQHANSLIFKAILKSKTRLYISKSLYLTII